MNNINLFFKENQEVIALPNWNNPKIIFNSVSSKEDWHKSGLYPATRKIAKVYKTFRRIQTFTGLIRKHKIIDNKYILKDFVNGPLPSFNESILLVGTPGPAQKLTLQLLDSEKKVIGYLKYAEKTNAIRSLENEYKILSAINYDIAPAPIKYGKLGNGLGLIIEPADGRRYNATLNPEAAVFNIIQTTLQSEKEEHDYNITEHPWLKEYSDELESEFPNLFECTINSLSNRMWPSVIQHGDFTPWNIIKDAKGNIKIIDWEYGNLECMPYFDIIFYLLQVCSLVKRWDVNKTESYIIDYCLNNYNLDIEEIRILIKLTAFDAYIKNRQDGVETEDYLQSWRFRLINSPS